MKGKGYVVEKEEDGIFSFISMALYKTLSEAEDALFTHQSLSPDENYRIRLYGNVGEKEVSILVTSNDFGNVYVTMTWDQLDAIYEEKQEWVKDNE